MIQGVLIKFQGGFGIRGIGSTLEQTSLGICRLFSGTTDARGTVCQVARSCGVVEALQVPRSTEDRGNTISTIGTVRSSSSSIAMSKDCSIRVSFWICECHAHHQQDLQEHPETYYNQHHAALFPFVGVSAEQW